MPEKIKQFAKNNIWYIVALLILFWVIVVNIFPDGYVLYGQDFGQMVNVQETFFRHFYNSSGNTALFYAFFYFLDQLGVNEAGQLSWYLGIFIFGSYVSFLIFTKLVFGKENKFVLSVISLFYALNLYTLAIFYYPWGYSSFYFLYIFIPVIAGLFLKFLKTGENIFGSWFILVLFLASPGFGNPAFALALAIFLFLLAVFSLIFRYVEFNKMIFKKLAILAVFSFIASAYWILPVVLKMKSAVGNIYTDNIIDLGWWIQHTSNPIINTLRLLNYDSGGYFPYNFAHTGLKWAKNIFIAFTFLVPVVLFFSIWQKKEDSERKKIHWIFLGIFLVFIMLVARVRFPFEKINNLFFTSSVFSILRGYDKLAIFTPFIAAVLLLLFFLEIRVKRYYKASIIIIVLILLTPLPFYLGKLQQNARYKSNSEFLVKIPEEYKKVRPLIYNAEEVVKIASLPYATKNIGWTEFPKWKFYGTDVTQFLYDKPFIDANTLHFYQWSWGKDFNEINDTDPEWVVKLLGMLNVKYVIYHLDVDEKFTEKSFSKIEWLENEGILKSLEKNDYFILYEIRSDYVFSRVGWQRENIYFERNVNSVNKIFDDMKNKTVAADFQIIHPKKYLLPIDKISKKDVLVLNEFYDDNWRAYYEKNGKMSEIERLRGGEYNNVWRFKENLNGGKIIIEYLPMKMFWIGAVISLAGVLFVVTHLFYSFYKNHRNGRNNQEN